MLGASTSHKKGCMYKYSVVYTDTVDVKTEFKNKKRRKKNSGKSQTPEMS